MNKKQQIYRSRLIRFRQWSRKGYAIFASLDVCTTIGRLRKNVTERALRKQAAPDATLSLRNRPQEQETDADTPYGQREAALSLACLLPQTENRICVAGAGADALASSYVASIKEVVFPHRENSLFSFKIKHYDNPRNQEPGAARHPRHHRTGGMAGTPCPKGRTV